MNAISALTEFIQGTITFDELEMVLVENKMSKAHAIRILAARSLINQVQDDAKKYLEHRCSNYYDPDCDVELIKIPGEQYEYVNDRTKQLKRELKEEQAAIKHNIREGKRITIAKYFQWKVNR